MARTEVNLSRQIRQESLRELLEKQGHLQHILKLADDLAGLDTELDALQIQRLRAVIDTKLKLLNKYLPDLKAVEVSGTLDTGITVTVNRKRFDGSDD